MKIFPAIDIIEGRTVRLKRGKYDKKLNYSVKPFEAAEKWALAGCSWLHVIDLDGARCGRPVNLSSIKEIVQKIDVPVQTGGGYRNIGDIEESLSLGVERVIVGSSATEDLDFAEKIIKKFGSKIIISCDAESLNLKTRGWLKSEDINIYEFVKKLKGFGAERIIYTDIRRDGMLVGPAVSNIEGLLKETGIKIISAGGIKDIEDVKKLKRLSSSGLEGVIIGRALYENTIDLKEAISVSEEDSSLS